MNCENLTQFFSADTLCGNYVRLSEIELPTIIENCEVSSVSSNFFNEQFGYDINFVDLPENDSVFFPLWEEEITWSVSDQSGNTSTCVSTFNMTDTIIPVMEVEEEILIILNPDSCFTSFSYVVDESMVSDNCAVGDYNEVQTDPMLGVGTNINGFTAFDVNGNEIAEFIVQDLYIIDTVAPLIECQDTLFFYSDFGQCEMEVLLEPEISEDESCPENLSVGIPTTDTYEIGNYIYEWTVIDQAIQDMIDNPNIPLVQNEFGQAVFGDTLVFDYQSHCTQTIIVLDSLAPIFEPLPDTIYFLFLYGNRWIRRNS